MVENAGRDSKGGHNLRSSISSRNLRTTTERIRHLIPRRTETFPIPVEVLSPVREEATIPTPEEELFVVHLDLSPAPSQLGTESMAGPSGAPSGGAPAAENPPVVIPERRSKLKYEAFRGRPKDDAESWIETFKGLARANRDDEEPDLLSLFQGLLKKDARRWYKGLEDETRSTWAALEEAFLARYKDEGAEDRYETQLRRVYLKPSQSVREFGEKVRSIVSRVTSAPSAKDGHKDFIDGLPNKMRRFVLQQRTKTLTDAIRQAETYENSREDYRGSRKSRREARERKRNHYYSSSSSTSSSGSSSSDSLSSSEEELRSARKKKKTSLKHHIAEKKIEKLSNKVAEEGKQMKETAKQMKEATEEVRKLALNFAESPKQRRTGGDSTEQYCNICGRKNHGPATCRYRTNPLPYYDQPQAPSQPHIYSLQQHSVPSFPGHQVYALQQPAPSASVNQSSPQFRAQPQFQQPLSQSQTQFPIQPDGSQSQLRPGPRACYQCGGLDHIRANCPQLPKLNCRRCGEPGHTSITCEAPVPKAKPGSSVKWLEVESEGDAVNLTRSQARRMKARGEHPFSTSTDSDSDPVTTSAADKIKKAPSPEQQPSKEQPEEQSEKLEEDSDGYKPILNKPYQHDIRSEMESLLKEQLAEQQGDKGETSSPKKESSTAAELQSAAARKDNTSLVHSKPLLHSKYFDILKAVSDLKVDISVGELVADNPFYRRQLKPLVASRRRKYKLPAVASDILVVDKEEEPILLDIVMYGCIVTNVQVDNGAAVNVMTSETAQVLGLKPVKSTSILRPFIQSRVKPEGQLNAVPFSVVGKEFTQNFYVVEVPTPSPFPILLGRPWCYAAGVTDDFRTKEISFGTDPRITLHWSRAKPQGETPSSDAGYTSEDDSTPRKRVRWSDPIATAVNYLELFEFEAAPPKDSSSTSK